MTETGLIKSFKAYPVALSYTLYFHEPENIFCKKVTNSSSLVDSRFPIKLLY